MANLGRRDSVLEGVATYAATVVLSILVAVWVLQLPDANLRIPFRYGGDALLPALETKAIAQNGGCLNIPQVGAPGALQMYDFPPQFDGLHLLAIKLMSVFSSNWALLFNLYFILGFPLIAIAAVSVFRHFGVSRTTAIAASILYAFLPSRLIKGQAHLFLDTFFQVPLAILLMIWVCGESAPLLRHGGQHERTLRLDLRSPRSGTALLLALVVGTSGFYYAFFSACLLIIGGAWGSIRRRSLRSFLSGSALAAVIALALCAAYIPTARYRARNGVNMEVANRAPGEAEVYGLRITQLLLPIQGHRLPALRNLEDRYRASAPMPGEYFSTSLGVAGSIGFLVLLATALLGDARDDSEKPAGLLRPLGTLNIAAVLLGTVGGFGSLFALLVSPQVRTYCRLNVFIAFLSLFAVALFIDRIRRSRPVLAGLIAGGGLVLGILDQTTSMHSGTYEKIKGRYTSDDNLVSEIERAVPAGSMIFQLPFRTFPESIDDYVLLRPYLHSRTLRWSYPTMRGRPEEAWIRTTAALSPADLLPQLRRTGFAGILIDRELYTDHGAAVERALSTVLGWQPWLSADGTLAFFKLA